MKNSQKGFSKVVILIIIAVIIFGGGAYYFLENSSSFWKTYTNNEYDFEIKYPRNWIITESKNYIQISDAPLVTDSGSSISIAMGSGSSQGTSSNAWSEERGFFGGTYFLKHVYFNEKNISISMTAENTSIKNTQDQIVSTFKFTK